MATRAARSSGNSEHSPPLAVSSPSMLASPLSLVPPAAQSPLRKSVRQCDWPRMHCSSDCSTADGDEGGEEACIFSVDGASTAGAAEAAEDDDFDEGTPFQ